MLCNDLISDKLHGLKMENKKTELREYQQDILTQLINSKTNDVVQLETGGGKTRVISEFAKSHNVICVAHRDMLVEQLSESLTISGVGHNVIARSSIKNRCMIKQRHLKNKLSYVASIKTLISRHKNNLLDVKNVVVIIDEAHHVAEKNQWAQLANVFKGCRIIGFTATPCRLDGMPLGKEYGGIFDKLIQAKSLKENAVQKLIGLQFLADYEAYSLPEIDFTELRQRGYDYSYDSLERAVSRDTIVSNIVQAKIKHAKNKLTIVFCPTVKNADYVVSEYRACGVSSAYIASTLSSTENNRRLDDFRAGKIEVLVNVEMATEGFDLPSLECVQMLRPTSSLALYKQMIGRALRPKKNNEKAIILDHCGNVLRHGLPDDNIQWSLKGTPTNRRPALIDCEGCGKTYNMYLTRCPDCGQRTWLLRNSYAESPLIEANIIDFELAKQARHYLIEKQLQDEIQKNKAEKKERMKNEVFMPNWSYGSGAINSLIQKLIKYMIDNLTISVEKINEFTQSEKPALDFWLDNFSIEVIQKNQTEKAMKAYQKWQKLN